MSESISFPANLLVSEQPGTSVSIEDATLWDLDAAISFANARVTAATAQAEQLHRVRERVADRMVKQPELTVIQALQAEGLYP